MIKICHIVNLITGKSDGVYIHLKMIFENSDKTKFQHYLVFQGSGNIESELSEMGVKVFVSTSLKKKISINAFKDIYKILNSNDIDIVQTHLIKPYAITGLVNIFLRKTFIFNYHGIFLISNPYYNFIERSIYSVIHYLIYLFSKVDNVLVPSRRSKELLMMETKLFPEPTVYYNGYYINSKALKLNSDVLAKIQRFKSDNLIIAIIGRLEVQKRIDKAIELFNSVLMTENKLILLVFGDGQLKSELRQLAKHLGIEAQVIFFDYVTGVYNYYNLFDVVLFTSEWEGMPLTMWEAMANGVPVVAPDVGGFSEILGGNNCGLIYEAGNLVDAEKKILELINNEKFRNKLGENGRAAIKSKYTTQKFIERIEEIYTNFLPK